MRALSDPALEYIRPHIGFAPDGGRTEWAIESAKTNCGILNRPLDNTHPTCCHCVLVCSGPLERRKELMELLHSSGVVIRLEDGTEKAVSADELKAMTGKS